MIHLRFLRTATINFALVVFSVLLAFGLLEILFRITDRPRPPAGGGPERNWVFDPDLIYRPREPLPNGPRTGKFRVLMIGDSLLGGPGSLVERTETILHGRSDIVPTEFINAGVPGYTNYQELVFLKKYGLAVHPDLVGVVFCLNDLHKFLHNVRVDQNGALIPGSFGSFSPKAADSLQDWPTRLARKSYFFMWLDDRLGIARSIASFYQNHGYTFDYRVDFSTAWQDGAWPAIESQMTEIVELGRRNGFKVFLAAVPFGEQLRKDYLARDYDYVVKPQRHLRQISEQLHIPYLDLLNDLDRDVDFLKDRIHLTPHGKQVVAERIATLLIAQGTVPMR